MVTDPVVAYFAAAPVTTRELGETFCTALFRSNGTDIEGYLRDFFGIGGAGTLNDDQAESFGTLLMGPVDVSLPVGQLSASRSPVQ